MPFPQSCTSRIYGEIPPRTVIFASATSRLAISQHGFLDEDFDVLHTGTTEETGDAIARTRPDLLLIAGMDDRITLSRTVSELREASRTEYLPIAVWTETDVDGADTSYGELLVDDVVSRLHSPGSCAALLRALLRRKRPSALSTEMNYSALRISEMERRIEWDGQEIRMTPTEYRLIAALVDEPSNFLSRPAMLHRVWGNGAANTTRPIDQIVKNIRAMLKSFQADSLLETVHGIGHRLSSYNLPK